MTVSIVPVDQHEQVADVIVLAMQTRDIEKGKGERDLSYWLLLELLHRFPGARATQLPDVFRCDLAAGVVTKLVVELQKQLEN